MRLTTPVYPGENESDADKRLQVFIGELVPKLTGYLPSEAPREIKPAFNRMNGNNS